MDGESASTPGRIKGRTRMINVLILYYSSYGHIEEMANAVVAGVLGAGGRVRRQLDVAIATQILGAAV